MATIPVFRTWVAGEVVTAAYFNANVRDAGNFLLSWPVFEGRQTVAQSTTSAVSVALTLDTEDIDTDNGHSTSTNTSRYTAQTAGRFQVSGRVGYVSGTASGGRTAQVWKNGTDNVSNTNVPPVNGDITRVSATVMTYSLNVNDFVEISAFQTSGGTINTSSGNAGLFNQCMLSVRMVGTT